jgi:hypothetical protein
MKTAQCVVKFRNGSSNPVAELRGERRQVFLRKRTPTPWAVASALGHDRTHALHNEFKDLLGASLTEWYPEAHSSTLP